MTTPQIASIKLKLNISEHLCSHRLARSRTSPSHGENWGSNPHESESFVHVRMNKRILAEEFFNRPTRDVAKELLGKFLVRKKGSKLITAMITEVEAYVGSKDKASHASRGRTARTEVMFGASGYWYIYLIYGMYHCVNIVTDQKGYPAAILIRGVKGISGPGRVAKYFDIDKRFNITSATQKNGLWIEDRGVSLKPRNIRHGKRIGVDYAGKWKDKPWRFYIDILN